MARRAGRLAVLHAGISDAFQAWRQFILLDPADGLQTSAQTGCAPAVARIEGEQPRVELCKALAAGAAGPAGRMNRSAQRRTRATRIARIDRDFQGLQPAGHHHHALAVAQRIAQGISQLGLAPGRDREVGHRQLDVVLGVAVDARPLAGGQEGAIDPQVGEALGLRPLGEVGVDALAPDHQGCEQADALVAVFAQDARNNDIEGLRLDASVAIRAVLNTDLDVEQSQKMIDLGERGHRALAPAAAGALLDCDGRWNAEDAIDIRARRGLHELPCIGIE